MVEPHLTRSALRRRLALAAAALLAGCASPPPPGLPGYDQGHPMAAPSTEPIAWRGALDLPFAEALGVAREAAQRCWPPQGVVTASMPKRLDDAASPSGRARFVVVLDRNGPHRLAEVTVMALAGGTGAEVEVAGPADNPLCARRIIAGLEPQARDSTSLP